MSFRWAAPVLRGLGDQFADARLQGTVEMIATEWAAVARCTRDEAVQLGSEIRDRTLDDFDQIPVVENSRVVNILVRGQGLVDVHSGMFMSADAPLVEFVESADVEPFRILLRGNRLIGLVTLSDLQRLPVYGLLFSMTVAIEAMLRDWIRSACRDDPDAWFRFLKPQHQNWVNGLFQRTRAGNLAIDRLSCATLLHEIDAAVGLGLCSADDEFHRELAALEKLRNKVCHVKGFAESVDEARKLAAQVREIGRLSEWLRLQLAPH